MNPTVFVVGDILIDRCIRGFASHVSPEAAAMVFVQEEMSHRPGGMWNTAANLIAAGGLDVRVFGVAGSDGIWKVVEGETFDDDVSVVFEDQDRLTQIKTRILAQHDVQLIRLDTPKDGPISSALVTSIVSKISDYTQPDMILLSDYGCGVVTKHLMSTLRDRYQGVPIVIDPYPTTDPLIYHGAQVITPNAMEMGVLQTALAGPLYDVVPIVIETRGPESTRIIQRDQDTVEVAVPYREMVDPCGAGDAFVAYLVAELAKGVGLDVAVQMANHAGACAVSHRGVVIVHPREIAASARADLPIQPPI